MRAPFKGDPCLKRYHENHKGVLLYPDMVLLDEIQFEFNPTPPHDLSVSKSVGGKDRAPDPWIVQTALRVGVVRPVLSDGNQLVMT